MPQRPTFLSFAFAGLIGLFAYSLVVACGEAAGFGQCVFDDDCGEGFVCVETGCAPQCSGDRDCAAGERCESRFRLSEEDLVNVCILDDSQTSNQNPTCSNDADCVLSLGETSAACSIDGLCFIPEKKFALLIVDTTTVDPQATPADGGIGADIAAIYLEDNDGNIVAQADTLVIEPANGVVAASTINGGPPSLNPDQTCVDTTFEESATVLGGAGGYLLVRFLDSNFSDYEEAPEQWNVVVIEWGDNCVGGDANDQYEVRVCEGASYESISFDSSCNTVLGAGSGRRTF